jgi:uncharacterized protein YecE (DUF72 family)
VATHIGTAGWNIPRAHRTRFRTSGSQLERYASRLNATEINSSFYRPHAFGTYERWAASVPRRFKFAVKVPKLISHERLLTRARDPLKRFLDETAGLGAKRGPLLLQLPPSFAFDARRTGRFLDVLRKLYEGVVVCEPRHLTWTTTRATRLFENFRIARVGADPPRAPGLHEPDGWRGVTYFRWHGSPRAYISPYSPESLSERRSRITMRPKRAEIWCIFDNTGSGAAAGNAMDLVNLLDGHSENRR